MKELELICSKACESFGVDIKIKKRTDLYVIGRHVYFEYAHKKTKYSLENIGLVVNKDHASVINSLKKSYKYRQHKYYSLYKPEFLKMIDDFYSIVEAEEMEKLSAIEIENTYLKRKLTSIVISSFSLRKEMNDLRDISPPKKIIELLENLSKDEIDSFIKYKVTPTLIMKASQDKRLLNYNPRSNKLTA